MGIVKIIGIVAILACVCSLIAYEVAKRVSPEGKVQEILGLVAMVTLFVGLLCGVINLFI